MEKHIEVQNASHLAELFGSFDANAKRIEKRFGVQLSCRDAELKVTGEENGVLAAERTVKSLLELVEKGEPLTEQNVGYCMDTVAEEGEAPLLPLSGD